MRAISLIAVLVVALALGAWIAPGDDMAETAAVGDGTDAVETAEAAINDAGDAPVPVLVLQSQARETTAELVLRGRTQANRTVEVAAETTGRVISEPLRRGADVAEGQVLCRLDPGVRAAELAEAEAAMAEAEAEASAATQLQAKGYTAETTLKARQAQLRAAQARLDKVRWDIEHLDIRSPFDGVLESDTAELGSLLVPGAACATVIDLTPIKVEAFVSEQEVGRLHVGQPARARLINGVTATGEITFISRMADEETRTYAVEVTMPNTDNEIRDGMTAELMISLPRGEAHLVPQSALTLDDQGRLGVRVEEDGLAQFYPVEILRDEAAGVWIDGLPDEADIIVVGQEFVREGRRVAGTPVGPGDLQ